MTSKAVFTTIEWELLHQTPLRIGAAVMMADTRTNIFGMFREALAMSSGEEECGKRFPNNELIQALIAEEQRLHLEPQGTSTEASRQAFRARTLEMCREAVALLSQKATPQETDEYRQWALAVGEQVANAASEGGFLGFGGQRVSKAEAAFLEEVAAALSV